MGSLAHYMQELSHDGFDIADFVHEGNGAIWDLALTTGPAAHAGWMIVEEQSEGGDILARRDARGRHLRRGMTRVCAGGVCSLCTDARNVVPTNSGFRLDLGPTVRTSRPA